MVLRFHGLAADRLLGLNAATADFKDEPGVRESYSPETTASVWIRSSCKGFLAYLALQHVGAYTITNQSNITGPKADTSARLQAHFNLYGINAARASDESTADSTNNRHLIRFSRRELGLQASYRF